MTITSTRQFTGTVDNDDIQKIIITRQITRDGDGNPIGFELVGHIKYYVNGQVETLSAELTPAMKNDVIDWLPTIRAAITASLGL